MCVGNTGYWNTEFEIRLGNRTARDMPPPRPSPAEHDARGWFLRLPGEREAPR